MKQKSISSRGKPASSVWFLVIFGTVFAVGGGTTLFTVIKSSVERRPLSEYAQTLGLVTQVLLVCAALGVVLVLAAHNKRLQAKSGTPSAIDPDAAHSSIELKPESSSLAMFVAMSLFALFWNGFVGFAVYSSWTQTQVLSLFMLPFIAVGIGLIAIAVYSFLKMFNPCPTLRLTPGTIPLGGTADLEYTIAGATDRIRNLRIWLEAIEEAKYQQGTDTVTKRSTFERIPIFETENASEMRAGTLRVQIPEFTMHSFEASHNKIIWSIKIAGDIPRWPDIDVAFPIRIGPLSTTQG